MKPILLFSIFSVSLLSIQALASVKEIRCISTRSNKELRLYIEQGNVDKSQLKQIRISDLSGVPGPIMLVTLASSQPAADRYMYIIRRTGEQLEVASSVIELYGPGLAILDRTRFDCNR